MSLGIELSPPGNGSQRVTLSGRLDTHTYEDLDEALAPLLTRHLQSLVLDLAALEYISSAGIRSVFIARRRMAERGGRLLVLNLQPQVRKVFDIVKAVPLSEIFRSVQEADAYLDRIQKRIVAGDQDD